MDFEASIDPELLPTFKKLPGIRIEGNSIDYAALRQVLREIEEVLDQEETKNEGVTTSKDLVKGYEGISPVPIFIYAPSKRQETEALPGFLWLHGGGFTIGGAELKEPFLQRMVVDANCIVVSVDYRLAPENPFPAALEDCYAVLKWMGESAGKLGIDPHRISVGGLSAGAGLTAALTLLVRDRKEVALQFQMLLYGCLDDRHITPSSFQITDRRLWSREYSMDAWKAYLGHQHTGEVSHYAAPARAKDLRGLPPAYVMVGELDLVRDENIDYAQRLMQAGVTTELHVHPGAYHGFDLAVPESAVGRRAVNGYFEAFNRGVNSARPTLQKS